MTWLWSSCGDDEGRVGGGEWEDDLRLLAPSAVQTAVALQLADGLVEREHCTIELTLNPGCQPRSAVALCK